MKNKSGHHDGCRDADLQTPGRIGRNRKLMAEQSRPASGRKTGAGTTGAGRSRGRRSADRRLKRHDPEERDDAMFSHRKLVAASRSVDAAAAKTTQRSRSLIAAGPGCGGRPRAASRSRAPLCQSAAAGARRRVRKARDQKAACWRTRKGGSISDGVTQQTRAERRGSRARRSDTVARLRRGACVGGLQQGAGARQQQVGQADADRQEQQNLQGRAPGAKDCPVRGRQHRHQQAQGEQGHVQARGESAG